MSILAAKLWLQMNTVYTKYAIIDWKKAACISPFHALILLPPTPSGRTSSHNRREMCLHFKYQNIFRMQSHTIPNIYEALINGKHYTICILRNDCLNA